jgi:hypothetical protein
VTDLFVAAVDTVGDGSRVASVPRSVARPAARRSR